MRMIAWPGFFLLRRRWTRRISNRSCREVLVATVIDTSKTLDRLSIHRDTKVIADMAMAAHSSSDPTSLAPCAWTVRACVEGKLQRGSYSALSRIRCEFQRESGVLHLRGSVPSYYLKQVAQELVRDVEGVRLVNNQLSVKGTASCEAAQTRLCPQPGDVSPAT